MFLNEKFIDMTPDQNTAEVKSRFTKLMKEENIEWTDNLTSVITKYGQSVREDTIRQCRFQLFKQLVNVVFKNSYPVEAVPKSVILSLPALMKVPIQHNVLNATDVEIAEFVGSLGDAYSNDQKNQLYKILRQWEDLKTSETGE